MPWCPKCKTEYIDGVEVCTHCKSTLVPSLEALEENMDKAEILEEAEISEEEETLTDRELYAKIRKPAVTYVRPEEKYKDTKSSGVMLTVLGIAGLLALAGIALDLIHLSMDPVMKYVFFGVMGLLFLVFFLMGLQALKKSGEYSKNIAKEKVHTQEILDWLCSEDHKKLFDEKQAEDLSPEEGYFVCQELMHGLLLEREPDMDESYMSYLVEQAYSRMYEQ